MDSWLLYSVISTKMIKTQTCFTVRLVFLLSFAHSGCDNALSTQLSRYLASEPFITANSMVNWVNTSTSFQGPSLLLEEEEDPGNEVEPTYSFYYCGNGETMHNGLNQCSVRSFPVPHFEKRVMVWGESVLIVCGIMTIRDGETNAESNG